MQITTKENEYCVVQVKYEADQEQIENKRNEVLSYFKKAPVKGFRPNKAPMDAIRLYYSKQINESLKRALAEEAFHNTMFEKNITPFGTPDFSSMFLSNKIFTCEFSVRRKPTFELAPYKELEIPKQPVGITIFEASEQLLQQLRIRYGDSVPYGENDFVQTDDHIIINYDTFDGDTKLDNMCSTGELLTVGKSQLVGFDDNLLGMKIGETREFFLTVPADGLASVAGKSIKFVVMLVMGSKVQPAPLNDELAKKMGKENFGEVQQYATETASVKVHELERGAQVKQISARLAADNNIQLPDWLVLQEAQYLVAAAKIDWETMAEEDKNQYLGMATNNVKLSLVLDKIRENEPEAQVSDQEVLDMISESLSKTHSDVDGALATMNKNGYLSVLSARIRDEYALDFVLKSVKWIE